MKLNTKDRLPREHLMMLTCGNESAAHFLSLWNNLIEQADDVVDETTTPEFKIQTFQLFNEVYSHPFYLAHVREFSLLIALINNAYADSEACAQSNLEWKKQLGDVLRHSAGELIRATAYICGGYEHMRSISMQGHEACWYRQHKADGTPE